MSVRLKKCRVCEVWYRPDPRTCRLQKVCGKPDCRRERKRQADRRWRAADPAYAGSRKSKIRDWAKGYPGYWRHYRATHPAYVQRNRDQTRERVERSRLLFAKQDAIRRDPVGYLEGLRIPGMFAKQDAIRRPIDGLVTFLVHREVFAKPTSMAPGVSGSG